MSLLVECGVVGQTVLYRAAQNQFGNNQSVGFGNYAAIYGAWCLFGRGAMVLSCVGYGGNLLRREPALQLLVGTNYACRVGVVVFATP